ncbi:tumor necrosis factor receptor superfamily member 10B-like isoform X2 [Ascaphus truei]|uniref:tumor necrosis factor receptor superfamily member 10B-like isoform X2 n=1 Tax=Ascaphus truei TaxID=8439 RepID=UPI003F59CD1C
MGPGGEASGHTARKSLDSMLLMIVLLAVSHTDSLPLRNDRDTSGTSEDYYSHHGIRCRRCPAGTYVEEGCAKPDTQGTCVPCSDGFNYSEHPTGLPHCLSCRRCREDQEEVSPCIRTQDTVCRCKEGTYCPPEHPCEVCLTCTPSCPPGQDFKLPCNSTSNGQCGPNNYGHGWIGWISVPAVLILLGLGVYLCLRNRSGGGNSITHLDPRREDSDIPLLPARLSFPEGADRERNFSQAFYVFEKLVPFTYWAQFVRTLGLTGNEIKEAEANNHRNAKEQRYDMLSTWHMHNPNRDVNCLLETLCSIGLQTVAQTITDNLLESNLFVRHAQS